MTPWLSPPTVHAEAECASVSKRRLDPERGGETMKTGRANR
jgi:hypothetical protein